MLIALLLVSAPAVQAVAYQNEESGERFLQIVVGRSPVDDTPYGEEWPVNGGWGGVNFCFDGLQIDPAFTLEPSHLAAVRFCGGVAAGSAAVRCNHSHAGIMAPAFLLPSVGGASADSADEGPGRDAAAVNEEALCVEAMETALDQRRWLYKRLGVVLRLEAAVYVEGYGWFEEVDFVNRQHGA